MIRRGAPRPQVDIFTVNKRIWTSEEDDRLRQLVEEHGTGNWSLIGDFFTGRTGKQCRERWTNHLCPGVKKGDWTEEEDRIIMTMQKAIGNQWAKITKMLPGRTDNAVKNRFHAAIRQRMTTSSSSTNLRINTMDSPSTDTVESTLPSPVYVEGAVPHAFEIANGGLLEQGDPALQLRLPSPQFLPSPAIAPHFGETMALSRSQDAPVHQLMPKLLNSSLNNSPRSNPPVRSQSHPALSSQYFLIDNEMNKPAVKDDCAPAPHIATEASDRRVTIKQHDGSPPLAPYQASPPLHPDASLHNVFAQGSPPDPKLGRLENGVHAHGQGLSDHSSSVHQPRSSSSSSQQHQQQATSSGMSVHNNNQQSQSARPAGMLHMALSNEPLPVAAAGYVPDCPSPSMFDCGSGDSLEFDPAMLGASPPTQIHLDDSMMDFDWMAGMMDNNNNIDYCHGGGQHHNTSAPHPNHLSAHYNNQPSTSYDGMDVQDMHDMGYGVASTDYGDNYTEFVDDATAVYIDDAQEEYASCCMSTFEWAANTLGCGDDSYNNSSANGLCGFQGWSSSAGPKNNGNKKSGGGFLSSFGGLCRAEVDNSFDYVDNTTYNKGEEYYGMGHPSNQMTLSHQFGTN